LTTIVQSCNRAKGQPGNRATGQPGNRATGQPGNRVIAVTGDIRDLVDIWLRANSDSIIAAAAPG
jgi:hypothetical protein